MTDTDSTIATEAQLAGLTAVDLRQVFRSGTYRGTTAGLAGGNLQCNLVVLPADYAEDFANFCRLNPVPCPLLARSEKGSPTFHDLGESIDLRFDLPSYFVHRQGEFSSEVSDLESLWNSEMCAFAIGCSFTFENALLEAGISVRHIEQGTTVPMYKTALQCQQSGPFHGAVVVSMRPIKRRDVDQVHEICSNFPQAHGAPIHFAHPGEIGINDIDRPDWGVAVQIEDDEVPVFWGCGVTTQVAVQNARPPVSFTHAPGAMLITDISERQAIHMKPM